MQYPVVLLLLQRGMREKLGLLLHQAGPGGLTHKVRYASICLDVLGGFVMLGGHVL